MKKGENLMRNLLVLFILVFMIDLYAFSGDLDFNILPQSSGISIKYNDETYELKGKLIRIVCEEKFIEDSELTPQILPNDKKDENIEISFGPAKNGVKAFILIEKKPASSVAVLKTKIENPNNIRIDYVRLFELTLQDKSESFFGLGQPVYYKNLFFGMEHPAAECTTSGTMLLIRRYYGSKSPQIECEPVIIGGGREKLTIQESFFEYILERKMQTLGIFTLYNTWYDLRDFDEEQCLKTWKGWEEKFINKYQCKLDSFVLDDGWDNYSSLWETAKDRFPRGFKEIKKQIESGGSCMGVWISPWGGYGKTAAQRVEYGKLKGYEILKDKRSGFCLAAPKYKSRFIDLCKYFIEKEHVNYFKFDGFPSRCSDTSHSHPVGDKFEQNAFADAFIDILKDIKEKDENIFLNLTTGVWLSPWWLLYGDAVWRDGNDYGVDGEGHPVQQSETYVDKIIYQDMKEKRYQFPISYLMTHGIIKGKIDIIKHSDETFEMWKDRVALHLARGVRMQELYINESLLTDDQWQFLADMLKWSRKREAELERTKMILGNPGKGEVYGYSHWKDNRVIIVLRNPSNSEKPIKLNWTSLEIPKTVVPPENWNIFYSSGYKPVIKFPKETYLNIPSQNILIIEGGF